MKRFVVISICLAVVMGLSAQSEKENAWSDLSKFAEEVTFRYEIDFSKAIINAMDVEDFILQEDRWQDGVRTMNDRFMTAFNKEAYIGTSPHRIVPSKETPYTITLRVMQVSTTLFSKRKTTITAVVVITDASGKEVFTKSIEGREGLFGTNMNLMGDAIENIGTTLGKAFYFYSVRGASETSTGTKI